MAEVAGWLLHDPGYRFEQQKIKVPFEGQIGNWRESPAGKLGYVRIRPGLYRPRDMPALPLEAAL